MTEHATCDPSAADDLFDRQQQELLEDLDSVLDVEAGLREVLLQSCNDTMTDGLNAVLDVEAGLAAILPLPAEPGVQATQDVRELATVEELLAVVSPSVRIALRRHPEVVRGTEVRELIPGLCRLRHEMAVGGRQLHEALSDRIDLGAAFEALVHFYDLAERLDETLAGAGGFLGLRLDGEARGAFYEVLRFAEGLTALVTRASRLDREVTCVNPAKGVRGKAGRNSRRQQVQEELRQALSEVRTYAARVKEIMVMVFCAVEEFTRRCVETLRIILAREVGCQGFPALALDDLHRFLDDFTTADLHDAMLADLDLTGVYWSVHQTRWPEAVDVECLKDISTEVALGSGIYVVRSGTATMREFFPELV